MSICRGLPRLNILQKIIKSSAGASTQVIRCKSDHGHDDHGHHDGRDHTGFKPFNFVGEYKWVHCGNPDAKYPKEVERKGLLMMVCVWWWVFHHIFTQPEVLFGVEYVPTHPERWTDEELGIPPDDE